MDVGCFYLQLIAAEIDADILLHDTALTLMKCGLLLMSLSKVVDFRKVGIAQYFKNYFKEK
jgi:hypothetical protein